MMISGDMPYMKSLVTCLRRIEQDGYTDAFMVGTNGFLRSAMTGRDYPPAEVCVINTYHFEGSAASGHRAVLYVIETVDDQKGTLVDAGFARADPAVAAFVREADRFQRGMQGKE